MSIKVNTPTHTNYESHSEYPVSSINMESKNTSCQQQYSASRKRKRNMDKSPNSITKRKLSHTSQVIQSQFHLGGNINDPLNLNSMCDDEINKSLNEHTPYSSPLPNPTRRARTDNPLGLRKIDNPQCSTDFKNRLHFKDPLHLKSDLVKARNASKKLALRNLSHDGDTKTMPQSPIKQAKNKRVSTDVLATPETKQPSKVADFTHKAHNRQKDQRYQYGNYSRYYGYRTPEMSHDHRLDCLSEKWFNGAEVLDIGCNSGQVTLEIARKFNPARIIGMDRDGQLIKTARKNVRSALSLKRKHFYPKSMPILYGPLAAQPLEVGDFNFPHNVVFVEGNYVLSNDSLLEHERPQYDTILALSVTKWVHLNDGDEGLKRFFKRVFLQLKPSGKFILEPQNWPSYKHKKNLTPTIAHNFKNIKLKPTQFTEYLLSDEVGFSQCRSLETPFNRSKGFRREMYVYTKPLVQRKSCNDLLSTSKESNLSTEDLKESPESNTQDNSCSTNSSVISTKDSTTTTTVIKEDEVSACSPVVFTIGGSGASD